jgi:AAA15 family ATPase/GTPase
MNSNNHLTYFKVENFKCFDALELNDIGQFNLIVGDNNVGKSSLLEALLFNGDINDFSTKILKLLINKGYSFKFLETVTDFEHFEQKYFSNGLWKFLMKSLNSETLISLKSFKNVFVKIKNNNNDIIECKFASTDNYKQFAPFSIDFKSQYEIDNFISLNINYSNYFFEKYNELISPKQTLIDLFNDYLSVIIPDLKSFHYRKINNQDVCSIGRFNYEDTIPLFGFGDGAIRLTRIILGLIGNNERLMIDEVDTGIHHSRMKDYLKKIILLAIENNTQLFLTTHSEECQKFFFEIFEDDDLKIFQEKVRHILLFKNANNQIISKIRGFESALTSLELGRELRNV